MEVDRGDRRAVLDAVLAIVAPVAGPAVPPASAVPPVPAPSALAATAPGAARIPGEDHPSVGHLRVVPESPDPSAEETPS